MSGKRTSQEIVGAESALAVQERRHERYRQQFPPVVRREPGQLDDPQAVLVFCKVDRGWRLYASRDIPRTRFWLTSERHPLEQPEWEVEAVMKGMLVIDRPTQTECLAELIRLWQARDIAALRDETRKEISR